MKLIFIVACCLISNAFGLIQRDSVVSTDKPVWQSSVNKDGFAEKAVDNDYHMYKAGRACATTQDGANNFWEIDLLSMYKISSVKIYFDSRDKSEQLNQFKISVGNVENVLAPCYDSKNPIPLGDFNVSMPCAAKGRFLQIKREDAGKLKLCEVLIYGKKLRGQEDYVLSDQEKAKQSSTDGKHVAGLAVDKIREHNFDKGSCSATKNEYSPWWQVDLGEIYTITTAVIYAHNDPKLFQLKNFDVLYKKHKSSRTWTICGHYPGQVKPQSRTVVPCKAKARYIRIRMKEQANEDKRHLKQMILCEVRIYGYDHKDIKNRKLCRKLMDEYIASLAKAGKQ